MDYDWKITLPKDKCPFKVISSANKQVCGKVTGQNLECHYKNCKISDKVVIEKSKGDDRSA